MTHAVLPETMLPATTSAELSNLRRLFCDVAGTFTAALAAPTETGELVVQKIVPFKRGQARSLSVYLGQTLGSGETVTLTVLRIRAGVSVTMLTTADKAITVTADLTSFLASVQLEEGDIIQLKLAYSAGATPTPLTNGYVRLQAE